MQSVKILSHFSYKHNKIDFIMFMLTIVLQWIQTFINYLANFPGQLFKPIPKIAGNYGIVYL